jgi:dTDP-4-amino-4,6-dideoxygalactose transaminase
VTPLAIHGGKPSVPHDQVRPWPPVDADTRAAVLAALEADRLGYGEKSATRQLEEDFARHHGRRHAIACNSGTTALLLPTSPVV